MPFCGENVIFKHKFKACKHDYVMLSMINLPKGKSENLKVNILNFPTYVNSEISLQGACRRTFLATPN